MATALFVGGLPADVVGAGTALVVRGCAFRNNSATDYGGAVFIKNDEMLERFNSWVVSGCRGTCSAQQ